MKLIRLAFAREMALPMIALIFASAFCVALVSARIVWSGKIRYAFLVWNLFLAWLPLLIAIVACDQYKRAGRWNWPSAALAGGWLVFFPNAPYIFTDLIHLTRSLSSHFWVDLALILSCALTGLVLGFLSLYLMHTIVRQRFGGTCSWLFIMFVAGLSGFGICIGRFLRFNSWDVLLRPMKLYRGVGEWVSEPFANSSSLAFGVLFAAFLFIAYVMLYGLTHLQHSPHTTVALGSNGPSEPATEPQFAFGVVLDSAWRQIEGLQTRRVSADLSMRWKNPPPGS
jgi:uncharacterized membrane protein